MTIIPSAIGCAMDALDPRLGNDRNIERELTLKFDVDVLQILVKESWSYF
jgi:hypothetical protein